MPMRRARFAIAIGCLSWAATASCAETVKATGHPNWPPFSWQDGDRIVGIAPELAGIIFKDVGLTVESVYGGNWKRAQAQVAVGAIDVLVAAYRTEERERVLAYPATPLMEDLNVVWVRKGGEFPFRQWADLIGKHGTAMLGESYGQAFDTFIRDKLQMEWVNTPSQSLGKLDLGRADYYPFSLYGGKIQIRQMGFADRITYLPHPISSENVYIALSKKSRFLKYLPQIEAAMQARRADGTVERLLRKYAP